MPRLASTFLQPASILSRYASGVAGQSERCLSAAAGGGFWQRVAAAAAAAVGSGAAAPASHQLQLQQGFSSACQSAAQATTRLPRQPASASAGVGPSQQPFSAAVAAAALQLPAGARSFATRRTRAERSAGGRQAAPTAAAGAADPEQKADDPDQPPELTEEEEAEMELEFESELRQYYTEDAVEQLTEASVGKFFGIRRDAIPEAFNEYYAQLAAANETFVTKGGCKGLQEELDTTTIDVIMFRQLLHELIAGMKEGEVSPQLLLDGPTGSGKSVALAALAEWGRASGCVVVYVPSASLFMEGGLFHKNDEDTWDTVDAAKLLMRTVNDAHSEQLADILAPSGSGSLADLVTDGIANTDPHAATTAAVEMLQGLKTQSEVPTMFVVDNWNALYWVTGYHEWGGSNNLRQRNILPIELRLAMAVRSLLEGPPPEYGQVVAATTHSAKISGELALPHPPGAIVQVEAFDVQEMAAWLAHLARCDVAPDITDDPEQIVRVWHLTGGNPKDFRNYGAAMLTSNEGDIDAEEAALEAELAELKAASDGEEGDEEDAEREAADDGEEGAVGDSDEEGAEGASDEEDAEGASDEGDAVSEPEQGAESQLEEGVAREPQKGAVSQP